MISAVNRSPAPEGPLRGKAALKEIVAESRLRVTPVRSLRMVSRYLFNAPDKLFNILEPA